MAKRLDTCCMCGKKDEKVKRLKTNTPTHPGCMDLAALSPTAEKLGWRKERKKK